MAAKRCMGQYPHMTDQITDPFVRGLKIIIDGEHHKMKPLALKAGMGESGVRDLFRNGSVPKVSNAHELAKAVGRNVDEVIQIGLSRQLNEKPKIAVPSRVGAGDEVNLIDDHTKGDEPYHVERPPQLPTHGIIAVEVQGSSMEPAYFNGDLLFYNRETNDGVPHEIIGKKVIAETEDGRIWVKQIKTGSAPGLWHLLSINPTGPNMHDVRVKRAAAIRLHLPCEFVKKI